MRTLTGTLLLLLFAPPASWADGVKGTSGAFTPCTTPTTMVYYGLGGGSYTFTVRAGDAEGDVGSDSHTFTVDLVAPAITLTATPPALSTTTSASFQWTLDETASVTCRLDGADPVDCTAGTTMSYGGLIAGDHTFTLDAADAAGNHATKSWAWHIDLDNPVIELTSVPPRVSNDPNPTITFTVSKGQVACGDESGYFTDCTTPTSMSYTGLTDGWYYLSVRAIDAAGRAGVAGYGWTVDRTPPSLVVDGLECGTANPTFTWTASDDNGIASVTCANRNPCPSPVTLTVPYGTSTTRFTATDSAGNSTFWDMAYTKVHIIASCTPIDP